MFFERFFVVSIYFSFWTKVPDGLPSPHFSNDLQYSMYAVNNTNANLMDTKMLQ